MSAAQRDERQSRLQARAARAPRHRDPAASRTSSEHAEERAGPRPSSCGASPRTTSSSRARRSARRREAEIKRDELKKTNPRGAGQQQTRREPGRRRSWRKARASTAPIEVLHASSTDRVPELPAARRGPLLPRLRVRAGERHGQRAQGLPRAHPEDARTRSTSRTRTSRSVSSSSTRRRATRASGTLAEQAYTEGHQVPAAGQQGLRLRLVQARATSSGTRATSPQRARRVQEDDRLRHARTRSSRTRRSSPTARARDIIPVYALAGDPTDAYNFFKNLSGDAAGANDKTFKMMDDLGQNYLDTGHYPEAIALYKDLMVRDRGSDKICVYQAHITEATMAMKSGNKDVIVERARTTSSSVYNDVQGATATRPTRSRSARTAPRRSSTETAMAWHLEAVGSRRQRGTGDPKTMDARGATSTRRSSTPGTPRTSRSSSSRAS